MLFVVLLIDMVVVALELVFLCISLLFAVKNITVFDDGSLLKNNQQTLAVTAVYCFSCNGWESSSWRIL